jgi:16S rRNA (guanine1207-N2)-methyltransferase
MAEHKPDHYYSPNPKSEARYGLVRACLRGKHLEFVTATGVFSIKRVDLGTQVLIDAMALPEAGSVLDVGCGYGAVGIAAGHDGRESPRRPARKAKR